jgi:hypothetical protein
MKKSFLLATFSTVGLSFPLLVAAEPGSVKGESSSSLHAAQDYALEPSSNARVITEEALEQRLTTEDLIGTEVVGRDDATLGEIVNVTLVDRSVFAYPNPSLDEQPLEDYREERYGTSDEHSDRDLASDAPASEKSPAEVEDFHAGSETTRQRHERNAKLKVADRTQIAVVIEAESGIFEEATLIEVPIDELTRNANGKLSLNLSLEEFNALAMREEFPRRQAEESPS